MIFSLPFATFASVEFFALLPNPLGDDTAWEYIEIRNSGCQSVDIGGYHLYDASNKTYVMPNSTIVLSHENIRLPYSTTKIALNNSGVESITLTDMRGTIIDIESYSGTQRDNVVIYLTTTDENCSITPPLVENNTGTTSTGTSSIGGASTGTVDSNTGTTNTGSWASETLTTTGTGTTSTGSVISDSGNTNSGTIGIGTTSTGSWASESFVLRSQSTENGSGWQSTGTTNTGVTASGNIDPGPGITNTGISNTGTIATGILFPEIIPTRQEPTNAIFTWGIWDCGMNQPCRINVTFEPIFTGWLLAKNYTCEVMTETGVLATCNPNTLYFSSGGVFTFRITSKIDLSQSRTMSWGVRFEANTNTIGIGTGSQTPLSPPFSGGLDTMSTGATNTATVEPASTWVTFPDIILTYQNYTNTTQSGDILNCTTSPCRVNFTLDPIFTGSFSSRDYTCEIRYGTGVYDSCNPPQLYPIGTGSIVIALTHKNSGKKEIKILEIIQNTLIAAAPIISAKIVISDSNSSSTPIDINPPMAILEYDGKLKSYHEQVGDYEMNCYTLTCAINLTADRSYDPEWGKLRWLWYYGFNDIKITKDPGERKYGLGDHEIWLRVVDLAGNMSEIKYRVHVLGPRNKEELDTLEIKVKKIKDPSLRPVLRRNSPKDEGTKQSSATKTKKKPKKMDFFDPPTITLQKSKFIETDDGYLCRTKTKTCSLNLTLSGTEKWISYTWIYDDWEVMISKNPKSKALTIGTHTIEVTASYGTWEAIWTRQIYADVSKIKKVKKPKKAKVKKTPKEKIVTKKVVINPPVQPRVSDPVSQDDTPYTAMALIWGIIPILLLRRILSGTV